MRVLALETHILLYTGFGLAIDICMKNYIKIILVQFIIQTACLNMIHAQEILNLQDFLNYQVTEKSEIYPMIEKAYVDIFKSKLNPSLCTSIGDVVNMHITLGLKAEKSFELSNLCKEKNNSLKKHFSRKYTVISDTDQKIPFDSWTNLSGMTYLIFDQHVSYEKLKLMLVHELAISLDAKSKMFYTTFLRHQNTNKTIYVDINDPKVEAFNYANRDDFFHSFAAIRAGLVEKYFLSEKIPQIMSHKECTSEFKKHLDFIRNNKTSDFVKKTTNDTLGPLMDLMNEAGSEKLNEANYEEHLKIMIDPSLKLEDVNLGQVTFCQYMAYPMFSKQSYYSLFSSGPRPRTGGGWGDESGGDSGGDASALVEKDLLNIQK